jgi:hypothetical protein
MRNFLFTLLLFISYRIAAEEDLLKVRELYYRATINKEASDSFYAYLKTQPKISSSLLNAYTGMSLMIKANHSLNPYNKLSFFTKGKDYLNSVIEKDPENIELRFLRFCVQTNAPSFLLYSNDISSDKAVIITRYHLLKDEDLKNRIKKYMTSSGVCTEKEKGVFN